MTSISNKLFSITYILVIIEITFCQIPRYSNELPTPEQAKTQDELFRTLSKSKASVWVDTNKGNVFSTSVGSSNLERKGQPQNEPGGHSKNMLLTLLIQPDSNKPIQAVPPQGQESNLKPILLLQQQQHDLSQIMLEKQEKLEKMNVQLQQQIKNQHLLVLDLLEHIKLFLEVIRSPSAEKLSKESLDLMQQRLSQRISIQFEKEHSTSSSSTANAVVTALENRKLNRLTEPENYLTPPRQSLLPQLMNIVPSFSLPGNPLVATSDPSSLIKSPIPIRDSSLLLITNPPPLIPSTASPSSSFSPSSNLPTSTTVLPPSNNEINTVLPNSTSMLLMTSTSPPVTALFQVNDNPSPIIDSPEVNRPMYTLSEVPIESQYLQFRPEMVSMNPQNMLFDRNRFTGATFGKLELQPDLRTLAYLSKKNKLKFNSRRDKPIEVNSDSEVKGIFRDKVT